MIGAIIGDIIGSRFEGKVKPSCEDFLLFTKKTYFTDDTVHTIAIAEGIMGDGNYSDLLRYYYQKYPYAGYGCGFKLWAKDKEAEPYNSWGNGSAMRVSSVGWAFNDKETVLEEAKKSAEVTHNHPEGIRGAQSIAYAILLARQGKSKEEIREAITEEMGYDLTNIPTGFQISCQETIPQAMWAFLESTSFIDAIRKAILIKGDADTLACIAGSIAQAYYGKGLEAIPKDVIVAAFERLPDDLANIAVDFTRTYVDPTFKKPAKMSKQAEIYDLFRSIFS